MKVQLVHARRRGEASGVHDPGAEPASIDDPAKGQDEDFVWSVGSEEVSWPGPRRRLGGRWRWRRGREHDRLRSQSR